MKRLLVFVATSQIRLVAFALLASLVLSGIASRAYGLGEIVFEPVALMGQAAPGTELGTVFAATPSIYTAVVPNIDDAGRLAFAAMLGGPAVTSSNHSGMWSGTPGNITLVARAGAQAPGLPPGVTFFSFPFDFALGSPLAAPGRLVLHAVVTGPGITYTNDEGVWSGETGTLSLLAREGGAVPGFPAGSTFAEPLQVQLSQSGHALLVASVLGGGVNSTNDEGFLSDRTGTLSLLFREGDAAPGISPAAVFGGAGQFVGTGYSFEDVRWTPVSQEGLQGNVTGPSVNTFNNEALYVERNGQLQLLAREDEDAPGAGHNVDFGGNSVTADFGMPTFNTLGQSAFSARIGGGIPTTYTLFSDHTGALAPVVMPGDPAPGTQGTFGILVDPVLSDGGRIAFRAALMQSGSYPPLGIWWDEPNQPGVLSALAVPGVTPTNRPGVVIASTARILGFNAAGTLAFQATLQDPQAGEVTAFVVTGPDGNLRVLVASGDLFDVQGDGSEYRQVSELAFGGMNASGQMAVRLDFTDGSFGFYRASPEATTDIEPHLDALGLHPRVAPNPFGANARLDFHVAQPGRVAVSVFDVSGRLVARLLDAPRSAGRQSLTWNGLDRSGSQVPSGIYWARIESPTGSGSVRLVRVLPH